MSKICKYCNNENTYNCEQCQRKSGHGSDDKFSEKCCGNCINFKTPLCLLKNVIHFENYMSLCWEQKEKDND